MRKRLVVIDRLDGSWLQHAVSITASGDEWDLLLLGLDHLRLCQKHGDQLARLGQYRILDLTEKAEPAHAEIRNFLIPFVHQLPMLRCPDGGQLGDRLLSGDGHWWWFLETSEKSPMRGPLVDQLYAVALVQATLAEKRYDELWLAIESQPLERVLCQYGSEFPRLQRFAGRPARWHRFLTATHWFQYWRNALRHSGRVLLHRWISALAGLRRVFPEPGSVLFYSVFPTWWLAPLSPGAADRFFPNLPGSYADAPVRYAVWLEYRPRELWRQRHGIRVALERNRMIPLQSFVSLRAVAELLSPVAFWKTVRFLRDSQKCLTARFVGLDVSSLVLRDLARSTAGEEFFKDRLLASAVGVLTTGRTIRAIVFRSECQPLERALIYGARDRTLTVGLWHSGVALRRNYLPFHFVRGEFEQSIAGRANPRLPLPDAMLASGTLCAEALVQQGYPPERIAVCGPVRHRHLTAYLAARPSRTAFRSKLGLPAEAVVLFVATSVVRAASEALLSALPSVVQGLGEVRIVLKVHPARPVDPVLIRRVLEELGREKAWVCPSSADMYDYITASDAVLLPGSTIAFEAMALGVMPIAYESPNTFNASSLADFADACFVARSPTELRQALSETLAHSDCERAKRRHWPALLKKVFHNLDSDPNRSLFTALASLGIVPLPASSPLLEPRDLNAPCSKRALQNGSTGQPSGRVSQYHEEKYGPLNSPS